MPERFGNYILERRLASGGMAEVFLARRTDAPPPAEATPSPVVVKRVLPSVRGNAAYADLLRDEARVGATLSHDNVVRTLASGTMDGEPFVVLEHVDGHDITGIIRQLVRRGARELPLEHVLTLALGASAGLAHMHERGYVHRDVSPPNVMASFAGAVKLVDLGLATRADASPTHETGTARGKPSYMSPEQARGDRLDGRSDVFALGIVLFELTTSKRLFVGQTEHETLRLVQDRDVPRPSTLRDDYPPALEPIVLRALARDPDARYASANAMHADLRAFADRHALAANAASLARFMTSLVEPPA